MFNIHCTAGQTPPLRCTWSRITRHTWEQTQYTSPHPDAATLVKQFGGRRCYGPSYSDLLAARVCGDGCCLILTRVYESWEVQGGRYLVFYVGGLEEAARGTLSEDVNF